MVWLVVTVATVLYVGGGLLVARLLWVLDPHHERVATVDGGRLLYGLSGLFWPIAAPLWIAAGVFAGLARVAFAKTPAERAVERAEVTLRAWHAMTNAVTEIAPRSEYLTARQVMAESRREVDTMPILHVQ